MSQVYRFTDENGQTRLMAEIDPSPGGGPAAGTYIPVADATGVTVDSTTYDDVIRGSGKLTTLVFPSDRGAIAFALSGDAFPRLILGADPTDYGLLIGDGSFDLSGENGQVQWSGGYLQLASRGSGGSTGVQVSGPKAGLHAARMAELSPRFLVVSGALPTVQLVSGAAAQLATSPDIRDVESHTPVTFNPGVATTGTCLVELSPDNVTYSALATWTVAAGTVFDGTIIDVTCRVPAGWYLRLTVNAQAVLGMTTYY